MIIDGIPHRTFRLSRLYFRYVMDSPFDQDHDEESFAKMLEGLGFIKVDWARRRYAELAPMRPYTTREGLLKFLTSGAGGSGGRP